ncbi:MAG: hypothetical protein K5871_07360 [Lachnospiraceae bacterium]|nr:hypothetical protein [Lachnospiraceae bacterium]
MHIALCDDNFGDRHQTERLLRRESDKQEDSSSMFIIDSYGSPETMLSHPRAYDLFIMDLCGGDENAALEVVKKLSENGATAPVVMCCSSIDYREMDFPENTMFIDKPIKVADLKEVLEKAQGIKDSAPDTIELRELLDTIYVNVSEVVYATEKGGDTMVTLMDGRTLKSIGQLWLFRRTLGTKHPQFIYANPHFLINSDHVEEVSKLGFVRMCNGKKILLSRSAKNNLTGTYGKEES